MSSPGGQESILIKDLTEFGKRLVAGAGVVTTVVAALPLTGLKWELWTPPWPPGAPIMASVVSVLWTLVLFFWRRNCGSSTFQRWFVSHIVVWIAMAAIYFALLAKSTGFVGAHRYIQTPWLTTKATTEIAAGNATENVGKLLEQLGNQDHDQDEIWVNRWVVKWLLLMTFFVSFSALTGFFALQVLKAMAVDIESGNGTWRN